MDPCVWQRNAVAVLMRFVKINTSKAARAGWSLVEDLWKLLYRSTSAAPQVMPAQPQSFTLSQRPSHTVGHGWRPARGLFLVRAVCPLGQGLCGGPIFFWTPATSPGCPFGCCVRYVQQSKASTQPPIPVQVPTSVRHGGFTQVGAQTLYTTYSTGRTYDASGPPPYPCSKCGCMHWSW